MRWENLFIVITLHIHRFCVWSKQQSFVCKIDEANQRIDSLIKFNTDENKLQYLAVLPNQSAITFERLLFGILFQFPPFTKINQRNKNRT
jgi:hypothetical protein